MHRFDLWRLVHEYSATSAPFATSYAGLSLSGPISGTSEGAEFMRTPKDCKRLGTAEEFIWTVDASLPSERANLRPGRPLNAGGRP